MRLCVCMYRYMLLVIFSVCVCVCVCLNVYVCVHMYVCLHNVCAWMHSADYLFMKSISVKQRGAAGGAPQQQITASQLAAALAAATGSAPRPSTSASSTSVSTAVTGTVAVNATVAWIFKKRMGSCQSLFERVGISCDPL